MASAHPPDPSYVCMLGVVTQCFTHCARDPSSQAAPFTGGCSIACPSRYFPCVSVCTRPCSGRRAVAVLREDSRPTLFTQTIHSITGLEVCTVPVKKRTVKKRTDPGGAGTHTRDTRTHGSHRRTVPVHRFKNTGSRDTHSTHSPWVNVAILDSKPPPCGIRLGVMWLCACEGVSVCDFLHTGRGLGARGHEHTVTVSHNSQGFFSETANPKRQSTK